MELKVFDRVHAAGPSQEVDGAELAKKALKVRMNDDNANVSIMDFGKAK